MNDTWQQGDSYDRYMGRWSLPVARRYVDWLAAPTGMSWLDVGCGTGALMTAIVEAGSPSAVAGVDASPGFVETARHRLGDEVDVRVGDAQALPFEDDGFHVVVSGLVLNFVPDPARAVDEMRRVTRSGGTVGVYLWDYAQGMEMIRRFWDVAIALDPAAGPLDEAERFPLCSEARLSGLLRAAGLRNVRSDGVEIETRFSDFDDFWEPFLGGQGPAPSYVAALDGEHRRELASELRGTLESEADRSIRLRALAWAVSGIV